MGRSFYFAILLVHLGLYISFVLRPGPFWTSFTILFILLIVYAALFERIDWKLPNRRQVALSILSGIGLYFLFFLGKYLALYFIPSLLVGLENFYIYAKPSKLWHYFSLFFVVIIGEELFWRGFILQRLLKTGLSPKNAIVFAALFYTSANLYAGSILLLLATFTAGIVWSHLYYKTNNIWTVFLSHIVFDGLLLMIFPLL